MVQTATKGKRVNVSIMLRRVVFVSVFLFVFLSACGGQSQDAAPQALTVTPGPTMSVDDQLQSITLATVQAVSNGSNITVDVSNGAITETEKTGDSLASNVGIYPLQKECFVLMKAIWTSNMRSSIVSVYVHIQDDLVDKYGNASIGDVGECKLTSSTEKLFVWNNLDELSAWKVYDYTWILPSLTTG